MVVEHAHAVCAGDLIQPEHLPGEVFTWREQQRQIERNEILAALKKAGGNISRAARTLRIHRTTLRRKLRRHKIEC